MKSQYCFEFVGGVTILSSLLVTLIKSATNPLQIAGLAGLLVIVGMLVFAVRDPKSVSDVVRVQSSYVRMYAVLALLCSIACSIITYA